MPNVALNKNADASSSMYPYRPTKAVDGVSTPLSRWVGSSPLPATPIWLRVDLGAFFWVNRWVLRQMGALGWSPSYNLCDYKLQGSLDNANWFDIDGVTNNSANQTDRPIASPRKVRWVRVFVTKGLRCNENFSSIADLEVYDAANAPILTGLSLSNGTLSPAFSSSVYSYSATVGADVGQITVTPTTASGTIRVNGQVVASGSPSQPIALAMGLNTVTVAVTSADGTMTDNYTIAVSKVATSAFLTGLTLAARGASMSPNFASSIYLYSATVAPNAATGTVTATAEDPAATIRVDNSVVQSGVPSSPITLNPGLTTIHVDVTASDGSSTKNYRIDVSK